MNYRELGRTGFKVSEVSFGAWAIGGTWGEVDDNESLAALHKAIDLGVNLIDTADNYGIGRSEKLVGQVLKERNETVYVATKLGRKLPAQTPEGYTRENIVGFVESSLNNLGVEALDLIQIHCPPNDVYYMPEVFDVMDDLLTAGKIKNYGVSVEKVEQALKAIEYPNVKTVQIIFNMFRHRPGELLFEQAKKRNIGILARIPLASGLLTGKMTSQTAFAENDHRSFNREGERFDKGETFSGVDYETGLKAVDELRPLVPEDATMAQMAIRWILMFDAVTCAIPGGKRPSQVIDNVAAADLPPLSDETMARVREIYARYIRDLVHHRW